jgi:hypothetical protein
MDLILLILGLGLVIAAVEAVIAWLPRVQPWAPWLRGLVAVCVLLYLLERFGALLPDLLP